MLLGNLFLTFSGRLSTLIFSVPPSGEINTIENRIQHLYRASFVINISANIRWKSGYLAHAKPRGTRWPD